VYKASETRAYAQARTYPRLPAASQPWGKKPYLLARRSSLRDCADPDDYELEEELEYDSDDYGYYLSEESGSLPRDSRAPLVGSASALANDSRAAHTAASVAKAIQPPAATAEQLEVRTE